jgi:hypothetical protein
MMIKTAIIRKLKSGKYRLYSRKKDKSGKRRNLGTYDSLKAVKEREKEIQYFKHHADDGFADDHQTKIVSKISDIAQYLEEAGFVNASDKMYAAIDNIDDGFDDNIVDPFAHSRNDIQMGRSKPEGYGSFGPGLFSIDQPVIIAKNLIHLANGLDSKGLYDEANKLDKIIAELSEMIDVIRKLDKHRKRKNKQEDKQKEEVPARSSGLVENEVTCNQSSGMFQGLSDAYFYTGYGNLGPQYK